MNDELIQRLQEVELSKVEPKFLKGLAHKHTNAKVVWWYNLTTGDLRASIDPKITHSNPFFKDVAYKPGWTSGRVFIYGKESVLIIYTPRSGQFLERSLVDLLYKLTPKYIGHIDRVVDEEGRDLSGLLENIEQEIREQFNIRKLNDV